MYVTELIIPKYLLSRLPAFTVLYLPSGTLSPIFTSTATFKNVISYFSFISQLGCTFYKKPSLIPRIDKMSLPTLAPTEP